jgi:hypothetical protein
MELRRQVDPDISIAVRWHKPTAYSSYIDGLFQLVYLAVGVLAL